VKLAWGIDFDCVRVNRMIPWQERHVDLDVAWCFILNLNLNLVLTRELIEGREESRRLIV
jgi:hypothetical protein